MQDHTHLASRRSFVASANGHPDFPIQNLPLGIFALHDGTGRAGVAIGDMILDLDAVLAAGLLDGAAEEAAAAAEGGVLNELLALGGGPRRALRLRLFDLLSEDSTERARLAGMLHRAADCTLHLPARIGDYTDFYAGIQHATNVGALFRPDNPLLPNYKYVPIGYHGRASSVVPSGHPVRRPNGQRKPATETTPSFGPSRNLDYELELGLWIGPGNALGEPIPIAQATEHIAGFCLLNDWSARDIQGWEYQPLGPFLAKNFCSTVSPWVITPEAMAPFRRAQAKRPEGDPKPMDYLWDERDQAHGALELELEVFLLTPGLREKGLPPHRLSRGHASGLYWTPAQLVAHHACGGCNLQPGDLLGTGTISSASEDGFGSLLEITRGGKQPVTLASGETRRFLEDGDEIVLQARARRAGFAGIGFGECRGVVTPAP
ncbi:fumarylacetoacetase [Falsiroseomonas oryzae]|uniref:fumarylacetoacetase n=1 Tax=Falsiroseomonas oryzae TaxID=2766473 RepID=UPI0022EACD74|nr:fumarylacetoacetase [Roseomonas sp. MO-31]